MTCKLLREHFGPIAEHESEQKRAAPVCGDITMDRAQTANKHLSNNASSGPIKS